MERAGAEVAVTGFSSSRGTNRAGVTALKPWTRRLPTAEAALKPDAFGALMCDGGTPMVAPALFAEGQLRARRVTRRVCIWLCDGEPGNEEVPALKAMFSDRTRGVEHVGIGLDVSLARLFPKGQHVMVNDMANLAKAFEQLLIPKPGARR
jgi:hypothetical protein